MSIEVNGVSLPDIPSDVLEQYPYAVIFAIPDTTEYVLLSATALLFYGEYSGIRYIVSTGACDVFLLQVNTANETEWIDNGSGSEEPYIAPINNYEIGWANYDVFYATLSDDGTITPTDTIYFPSSVSVSYYAAPKSWYDGMAQQVMRLSETTSKLTTDAMLSALKGVEAGGEELPNAEDYAFGEEAVDGREAISFNSASGSLSTKYTFGLRFTAAEAFQIVGFAYAKDGIYIWDADENLVKEVSYTANSGTYTYELDEPFVVNAGETYTIGSRFYNSHPYVNISACAFDAALGTVTAWVSRTGSLLYPENSTTYIPAITMTIASIAAEDDSVPKTYQIMLGTMTEIAEEVKRISGTELDKLTPAQIITALQGVT